MADRRSADCPPCVFSEAESDVEEFVGFDARDTRRYAEIANRAPLFSSTPIPKAKRVRINTLIDSDDSLCSNLDDDQGTTTLENLPCEWNSSSSLVEGELAPVIFEANSPKYGAANSHASINEESSSSSLEGEIFGDVTEESKEQLTTVFPDNTASFGQEAASATLQQTEETETPKLGTCRGGKTTAIATFSTLRKLNAAVLVFRAQCLVSNVQV